MITDTRQIVEHEIGPTGAVTIRGLDGLVEVHAVDAITVRVKGVGDRPLEDDFEITRGVEILELAAKGLTTFGFRWLGGRRCQAIRVEVPRGSRVEIGTASGAIVAGGIAGDQRYHTVSGDIQVELDSARISTETVSGRVRARASGRLVIEARTVSGDLSVSATTLAAAQLKTTSGDLSVSGDFRGEGPYRLGTVSGNVTIAATGPIRVEGRTISGDVRSALPHRSGGKAGRRKVELGEGGPLIDFSSISGGLEVVSGPGAGPVGAPRPASTDKIPTQPQAASASRDQSPTPDDQRMAVLRDLEAGRIPVDEADRRLAELDGLDEPVRPSAAGGADFSWVRRA